MQDGEFGGEGGQGGGGEVIERAQADGGEDKAGAGVDAGEGVAADQGRGEVELVLHHVEDGQEGATRFRDWEGVPVRPVVH